MKFRDFIDETIQFFDEDGEVLFEKKISELTPEQHKLYRQNEAEADEWHKNHPVHHQNIINHYNQATAEEKHHGHSWYADAHHLAKTVAKDTKTSVHTMAGLISNYSPQTQWHTNLMTAAKVAKEKRAMGGAGSGVFATEQQKHAAHRLLEGEHYDHVLVGHKTRHFAHLIEHGGNKDPGNPRVVVDRHAYSVAAGARIPDAAFGKVKLKSKRGYEHVANAYHKASKELSKQHGMEIHPHQVQATTWLVRQRLNRDEDNQTAHGKIAQKSAAAWNDYAKQHHPKIVGKEPGSGYAGLRKVKKK